MLIPKLRAIALALWLPAALVPAALLMASHLITLPTPSTEALASAIGGARAPAERGRWLVLHALYGKCGCSRRVVEHLVRRRARRDVVERVLLVDGEPELLGRLTEAGFLVEPLTAEALHARYHVESVPLLVVASPEDRVAYVGGYTERQRGPDIRDVAIVDAALRGVSTSPLPLFGCAVSEKLQRALDPLGLKY